MGFPGPLIPPSSSLPSLTPSSRNLQRSPPGTLSSTHPPSVPSRNPTCLAPAPSAPLILSVSTSPHLLTISLSPSLLHPPPLLSPSGRSHLAQFPRLMSHPPPPFTPSSPPFPSPPRPPSSPPFPSPLPPTSPHKLPPTPSPPTNDKCSSGMFAWEASANTLSKSSPALAPPSFPTNTLQNYLHANAASAPEHGAKTRRLSPTATLPSWGRFTSTSSSLPVTSCSTLSIALVAWNGFISSSTKTTLKSHCNSF